MRTSSLFKENFISYFESLVILPPYNKIQKIMYQVQVDNKIQVYHYSLVVFEDNMEQLVIDQVDLDHKYDWHLFFKNYKIFINKKRKKNSKNLCRSDSSKDGNFAYAEFNLLSMRISACVNGTRPVGICC